MGELYIHNLQDYIDKFGLTVFIETGTGKGIGIYHALKYPFTKLFSIEFIYELWRECADKINDSRLQLYRSDSVNGLDEILFKISKEERVLYWLDAHFPGADFKFNGYDHLKEKRELHKPLEAEFNIIFSKRDISKDVFIIDDLRIYEEGNFELGQWELKHLYGEPNLNFILDRIKNTHNIIRDYRHQGFLILTPK